MTGGRRSARRGIPRADPAGRRRLLRGGGALGLTLVLGAGLLGCADGAARGLVQQACQHVQRSLELYQSAQQQPDAKLAADERARASAQLTAASPLAAEAAGQAPQWQALMATLAENSRLPESDLVPALRQQCAVARSGGTTGPSLPVTTLPPPPGG